MTYLGLFPMKRLHTVISRYSHPVFKENNRTVVMGIHFLMPPED